MAYKSLLLWDFKIGLELDKIPALLPNDGFEVLENAYLYRKRVKKKQGAELLGRLQQIFTSVSIGNSGTSPWTFNVFTILATGFPQQQLNPGSMVITIGSGPGIVFTDQGNGTLTSTTTGNSGAINYATGAITLITTASSGTATTATFGYYPGEPVMGLPTQELLAINAERLLAFDQTFAYQYSNSSDAFIPTPSTMAVTWSGSDSNFFWYKNALGAIFVTNGTSAFQGYTIVGITVVDSTHFSVTTSISNVFQVGDHVFFFQVVGTNSQLINGITGVVSATGNPFIVTVPSTASFSYVSGGVAIAQDRLVTSSGDGVRWYDGSTWSNFQPPVNATSILIGCLIIFYYRDRIIVFVPTETTALGGIGTQTYYQRGRWCQNGTPYYASAPIPSGQSSQSNAWQDDVPGKGGFVDAPTSERIISASLIKDNMIVRFERSTWRFRYTGNEELPFQWERINAEYGADSTFSGVNFDVGPIDVGSRGITQTDGISVLRIDNIIPDEVFEFENLNSGPQRIWGIRDFDEQVIYWCFPNDQESGIYPNRVLLYNYRDPSFGIFRDSYTAFGFWQSFNDLTWGAAKFPWGTANFPWGSGQSQALYQKVVGGNQQGYVMVLQQLTLNEQSLRIEAITAGTPVQITSTNHNLTNVDYVNPINIIGNGSALNGNVYGIEVVDANNFLLFSFSTASRDFDIPVTIGSGTYLGAGEICRVDNFRIRTKKFNPSIQEGAATRLGWVDFYVDATNNGQFIVNYYVDDNDTVPVNLPSPNPMNDPTINPYSNVVETNVNQYETQGQTKVWHTLYNDCVGSFFQLEMTLSPEQINNLTIAGSDIIIHAMNIWTEQAYERLS